MKQFSKKLLAVDYIITTILLILFFVCVILNGAYAIHMSQECIKNEMEMYSITFPFDLTTIGIVIGTWVAQLGLSSAAYYVLIKSEHKIELPMRLLNELPDDIKERVDMNTIITTVLSTSDN